MNNTKDNTQLIVSVSGVRGIVGEALTPEVALRFGRSFGKMLSELGGDGTQRPRRVAVGRDSRLSGPMIQSALTAGLLGMGVEVSDLGVAATPSIALMGRFLTADGAIVVTASHNPSEYNGLKFLRHDGIAFPAAAIERLKSIYAAGDWRPAQAGRIGTLRSESRAHAHHVQCVLQHVDARPIAAQRHRVVLDSINGAGCIASPMLLGKLGVELVHINSEATGQFAHAPEPTRENLASLGAVVERKKAAVGFAQDPDADRLAVVDETGRYIGEEYTLALAAFNRLSQLHPPRAGGTGQSGVVVCNLSTSRMIDDIAARFGCSVARTPVGEANVAGKMLQTGAILGGEGNGGVIDPRIGPVRDSLIAMAMILELMTRTQKTISQLVGELPAYAMIKTKFAATRDQAAALVEKVKTEFADQNPDIQDGVRIDWPDGWVHVRPSNTEPIARVIAEAADEPAARELIARVEKLR